MLTFIIGLALLLVGVTLAVGGPAIVKFVVGEAEQGFMSRVAGTICAIMGTVLIVVSTAIYVEDNQGGVVVRKFGTGLSEGRIIAVNGEKGPQAKVLPPGWHFFYWPWLYDLEPVQNIEIPEGQVGVVVAKDGEPLPAGEVYAPAWEDVRLMLDAEVFLSGQTSDGKEVGKGFRGPQLSVITPGQYRYNPRLFDITIQPCVTVNVGQVLIIKANAGKIYEGEDIELVNGVPIVPNGYRGIWREALTPNQYYMHPDAYEKVFVRSTNRIYSYTGPNELSKSDRPQNDNSIGVRTIDGFEFPVDIRVSAKISAENAPYVVAQLADPDADVDNDGFDQLEEIVILPAVRAIFRNSAENRGALEYVASRSEIENSSTDLFKTKMMQFKIETDGLFVADIGLSKTSEGKQLLQTQTDKEVANQEQDTWSMKQKAAIARAASVRAEEEADQEKLKVAAEAQKEIKLNEGQAEAELAKGRAEAIRAEIEALGSAEAYVLMKLAEGGLEQWQGSVPEVVILGGEGKVDTAVLSKMLQQMKSKAVE
jgi:hypothetical protein